MKMTKHSILAAAAILASAHVGHTQSTFTKITTGPIVNDGVNSVGAAWVDVNGDGKLDLYVANPDGVNRLYVNDGHGTFTRITNTALAIINAGSYSVSWADVDNDGRPDLHIGHRSGTSQSLLFRQQADGTFVRSTLEPLGALTGAWADYNRDGFIDLVLQNTSANILWLNNGKGDLTGVRGIQIDTDAELLWADIDGDGDMDLLAVKNQFCSGITSHLYRNDGGGVFTSISGGQLVSLCTEVLGAAFGDYDNDGFLDLYLPRGRTGQSLPSFLFHNNHDGTFTQVQQSPFTNDFGLAMSASWADYDNDGWLDLFVSENDGIHYNRLYHNNGDGTFTRVQSGPFASDLGICAGSSWGDYDRDGFLDLFVSSAGNDYLYHNDGNSNAWVTIKCVGTRSNRSAIGAKVRVKATLNGNTFWQTREINTGDGWAGNPLEAHFGLGNATNVETLRIEWPSGTVQELQNVPAKQYVTVTEPSRLLVGATNGVPQLTLQGGRNLEYDIQTSTNLIAWSLLSTLTIANLNGTANITDTNVPSSDRRYYRAVLR
jgi:enediyne biosynthesis protein E4